MTRDYLAMLLICVPVGLVCGVIGVHWAISGVLGGILTYCYLETVSNWLEKLNSK